MRHVKVYVPMGSPSDKLGDGEIIHTTDPSAMSRKQRRAENVQAARKNKSTKPF